MTTFVIFSIVASFYCFAILGPQFVEGISQWGYSESDQEGPANWSESYPNCGRHNQSPINFDTTDENTVKRDENLEEILFVDYEDYPPNKTWQLLNNGHTVLLQADFQYPPRIQRGSLNAKYQLLQIHFHWSSEDFKGSEHHVNGRQYSLEMHLVHKRIDSPTDADSDAVADPNNLKKQLAVVGVFFNLVNESNQSLKPLIDALGEVEKPETSVDVRLPFFTLQSLLPVNRDYFRYSGSLTTPPCDAIVQWSVLRQPVSISLDQLEAFRKLRTHSHNMELRSDSNDTVNATVDYIVQNVRPVQPLGDRNVLLFIARRGEVRADFKAVASGDRIQTSTGYLLNVLVNLSIVLTISCHV